MKKIFLLLVLAGIAYGGYYVYTNLLKGAGKRACVQLAELCGGSLDGEKLAACEDGMTELKKVIGEDKAKKAAACIMESKSCLAGMGCMTGAGLGAAGEFINGFKRALQDE